jgi:hypothetical protein
VQSHFQDEDQLLNCYSTGFDGPLADRQSSAYSKN